MPEPAGGLGPFEAVRTLRYEAPLPRLVRVRQRPYAPRISDVAAATLAALDPLRPRIRTGLRVAVTAGSRGIAAKPAVLRAAGEWLRAAGAEPFAVPAMGSHGGATAEGQLAVLTALGVTSETIGMPIRATMDTVELGPVPGGPVVHLDRYASGADAILLVNRVKAHTDFAGEAESGLAKILAIGLGKQRGAEAIHRYGPAALAVWIPRVARRILDTGKVLGGLAIVDNAHEEPAMIEFVEPDGIGGPAETRLLAEAKRLMATLPFDQLDVAVVQLIGKDKSGSGLDTTVIGRMAIAGTADHARPRIGTIAVLDVTDASHGNVTGLGLADFVPLRLLTRIDLRTTYINAITSGLGGVQRARMPLALPTDRDAICAAVLCCGRPDPASVRLVQLRNTLELNELLVSESLLEEVAAHPRLEVIGEPAPMTFDGDRLTSLL